MGYKELYEKIRDQAFSMRKALGNTVSTAPHINQMKNVLYNNLDEIEEALKFAMDAEKKIKVLEVEIDSADAELQEKDDYIRELKEALEKKPNGKRVAGKRAELPVIDEIDVK